MTPEGLPSPEELLREVEQGLFCGRLRPQKSTIDGSGLGAITKYVVEDLPHALVAVENEDSSYGAFCSHVTSLARAVQDQELIDVSIDSSRADRASLDVNFLVAATFHAAPGNIPVVERVPGTLGRLAVALGRVTGKIPTPSYEDLIFINDLSGPARVFSTGGDALAERDFYLAHRYIERCFDAAIANIDISLDELAAISRDMDYAAARLQKAIEYFDCAADILRFLGRTLEPATFKRFRPFFFTITLGDGEYVGPSGRYTTGLPIIETLVADATFSPPRPPEMDAANPVNLRAHFPRAGLRAFDRRFLEATRGRSLGRHLHALDFPQPLTDLVGTMVTSIKRFRLGHRTAVVRQIEPEGLESPVTGTGGIEDVGTYFETRIRYKFVAFPENPSAQAGIPR